MVDPVSDNGLTVRQRVFNALEQKLIDMVDKRAPVWVRTFRGDLEDIDNSVMPVAAIDCSEELKITKMGLITEYELPVFFHFRFRGQKGLDEIDVYAYYLGLLQFALLGDHNLNGLTINVEEVSNNHTIIGVEGVYPGGTLSTLVTYRTRLHNPYKLPHEI